MRAAWTAALGTALVLAGATFASPSLAVPGFALTGLGLTALAWVELAARGAAVARGDAPARIVEGDAFPLELELRRGLLPPPGGELYDPLMAAPVRVGPWRPRRVAVSVAMPRRGRHRLDRTVWTISDPLRLHTRAVPAPAGGELLVLPRVEKVSARRIGIAGFGAGQLGAGDEGASTLREARAVDFEIDGLRPYRQGSAASRIHWPALARSGEMHERRVVAGAQAVPLIVLDAERPASDEALDRAVRAAASLCVELCRGTGCQIHLPGLRVPVAIDARLRSWPQVHARLAVVAAGQPTRPPGRAARTGSVFWVTAGSAARMTRLVRTIGAGPHYTVSAQRPAGSVAFEVAGCYGSPAGGARLARKAA